MDYYVVSIYVYLSNNETIHHNSVWLSEQHYCNLFQAHQEGLPFFATIDAKSLGETFGAIAIDYSSPHVVGMGVRVLSKETSE